MQLFYSKLTRGRLARGTGETSASLVRSIKHTPHNRVRSAKRGDATAEQVFARSTKCYMQSRCEAPPSPIPLLLAAQKDIPRIPVLKAPEKPSPRGLFLRKVPVEVGFQQTSENHLNRGLFLRKVPVEAVFSVVFYLKNHPNLLLSDFLKSHLNQVFLVVFLHWRMVFKNHQKTSLLKKN